MKNLIGRFGLYFAWVVSLVATMVSLYTSEILKIQPCSLCWYQRVCLFSLVIMLGIAAYRRDTRLTAYILPQVSLGALIAAYQLYSFQPLFIGSEKLCGGGACQERLLQVGVSYPILAICTFVLIGIFTILARTKEKQTGGNI